VKESPARSRWLGKKVSWNNQQEKFNVKTTKDPARNFFRAVPQSHIIPANSEPQ
jgi:hypothetical protein